MEVWDTERTLQGGALSGNEQSLKEKALIIANNLLGVKSQSNRKEETIEGFLSKEFEVISLETLKIDFSVIDILNQRITEVQNSIRSRSALSCIILCGSILEGIFLGIASNKMREFNQCDISPKNRTTQRVLPFNDWSLSNFIDVSHNLGLIGLDVKKYSHY
ncbi:hypothetical protein [Aequorivita vladivostokensis]|uniref:hypothetical protein n=1 Tax=Aequorivita vladivostokensis TaxID=171194 RepID=UPI00103D6B17|nr:hypothetical protein [Aequorivita vladivostokensis]